MRLLEKKREKKGVKQPFSTDKDYTIFDALLEILKKQDESFSSPSFQKHGSSRRILIASFFVILGAATLIWVGYLAWYDITVWGKDIFLIFFGSRVGEAISLGIGMRLIAYLLIGIEFVLLAWLCWPERARTV